MKIYTFICAPASKDVQPETAHVVAGSFEDAIVVAKEKGFTGYAQVSEGPEVLAVAGMFE